jgi:hypothetical protein
MSDFAVIGVVGEILKGVLRTNLRSALGTSFDPLDSVTLLSPNDLEGVTRHRLSLFLYQIAENAHMKNQPMERVQTNELRFPPLSLNLYYLLTPFAGDETNEIKGWDAHTILGKAMQVFYDNAVLDGPNLMGILQDPDVDREEYYDQIKQIKIILAPISLDDMTKIWNSLETPFRLSVCYEVRVIMIESERKKQFQRILEKQTDYHQIAGRNEVS